MKNSSKLKVGNVCIHCENIEILGEIITETNTTNTLGGTLC